MADQPAQNLPGPDKNQRNNAGTGNRKSRDGRQNEGGRKSKLIKSLFPDGKGELLPASGEKIRNFIRRTFQIRKKLIKLRVNGRPVSHPVYTKPHICRNCKTRFTGKYCYNCGQSARITRLNFSSVLDNLLDGMTNVARGSFFTIINLFTRPGYMINDYIKGKRIIFAKPFQMLFVLAALYALCGQLKYSAIPENEPAAGQDTIRMENKAEAARADAYADVPAKKRNRDAAVPAGTDLSQAPAESEQQSQTEIERRVREKTERRVQEIRQRVVEKVEKRKKQSERQIENVPAEQAANGTSEPREEDEDEKEFSKILKSGKNKWKESMKGSPFLSALLDLLYKWFHSNRALQEILIIPVAALGMKWAFRKSRYNARLNFIEYSFAGAFISCQALIISLAVLLFDLKGSGIIAWSRFICTFWVCKELFRNGYSGTFWRLVLTMLYILLIIILFATIIITIIALIYYGIYKASLTNPATL